MLCIYYFQAYIHGHFLYQFFDKSSLTLTLSFPCTLIISPNMADNSDDFPCPTCPTTATRLPSGTVILTLNT
jgi:hypothetical protein